MCEQILKTKSAEFVHQGLVYVGPGALLLVAVVRTDNGTDLALHCMRVLLIVKTSSKDHALWSNASTLESVVIYNFSAAAAAAAELR